VYPFFKRDSFFVNPKHWALSFLVFLYGIVLLAPVFSPYAPDAVESNLSLLPPTPVYWMDEAGKLTWPYVLTYRRTIDEATYQVRYVPIENKPTPLRLFVKGDSYKLFGLLKIDIHLVGVQSPATISVLGRDANGRDIFSRLLSAGKVSLFIGFFSLLVSLPMGLGIGALSGYMGGRADALLMRFTEVLMSIPSIFLLVSLAALLPANLSSSLRFILVSMIMASIGWTGLARVIRGMVLNIKQELYVDAARCMGASLPRLLFRHILPQTASYVVVALTLGVPGYILAESGLSFLGLGIQQPDASWGNMLKEAQQFSNLIERPWMLAPALLIFLAVWAYNVLGRALRDELDPNAKRLNTST
jgi:peptide/nickel transport system permease protein